MSDNKADRGIIYKCPACLNAFIDVVIEADKDGIYRCLKCGYNNSFDGLMAGYEAFRERYKLKRTRLALDDQRKM